MQTTLPLITVIIPVYNTEIYVKNCLDSLFSQTYKNLEIVIVNNGSSGNIDEIFNQYTKRYDDRKMKLVRNEQNLGTFHGRGSGMSVAEGEYFTFMDADDRVDSSYFEAMALSAVQTNADIVTADMVHEDENGNAFRYTLDPVRTLTFEADIESEDPFDFYYSFQGLSYSMYGIWNKIYRRDLWDRSKWLIDLVDEQFALCEDAAYTTIFFSQAKKISNIHDHYYYHFVHSDSASGNMAASYEKAERSIFYQGTAFRQINKVLIAANLYNKYKKEFKTFRNFHCKVFLYHIDQSKLSFIEKKNLRKKCLEAFDEDKSLGELTNQELIFTKNIVEQTNHLESIRDKIIDINTKLVSFDIFGTALLRDVLNPGDVFEVIDKACNTLLTSDICFYKMRTLSEEHARNKMKRNSNFLDITFDEIYDSMQQLYNLDDDAIETLKMLEVSYEMNLLKPRKITQDLFNLAISQGKTVIFISDMYHSKQQLFEFLKACGYYGEYEIYVSSEYRYTKADGSLFSEVFKHYPKEIRGRYIHIGDDSFSDVTMGRQKGFDTILMPKPTDILFYGADMDMYCGEMVRNLYGNYLEINNNYDLRLSLSLAANKAFDNPYVNFSTQSDFNGDPYLMGLLCGGPYINNILKQLFVQVKQSNLNTLVFLGNDSNLIRECFSLIIKFRDYSIDLQERALTQENKPIPLVYTINDMRLLSTMIDVSCITPKDLLNHTTPLLKDGVFMNAGEELVKAGFVENVKFTDIYHFSKFVDFIEKHWYDEYKASEFFKRNNTADEAFFITGLDLSAIQYCRHNKNKVLIFSAFDFYDKFNRTVIPFERKVLSDKQKVLLNLFFGPTSGHDVGTNFVLSMFHKGVKEFIAAYYTSAAILNYDWYESEKAPMYYLLNHAKPWDTFILNACDLEKVGCSGEVLWILNTKENYSHYHSASGNITLESLPCISRVCYLMLRDRAEFKLRAKKKLAKHPLLLMFGKSVYKKARKVYHLVQKH